MFVLIAISRYKMILGILGIILYAQLYKMILKYPFKEMRIKNIIDQAAKFVSQR